MRRGGKGDILPLAPWENSKREEVTSTHYPAVEVDYIVSVSGAGDWYTVFKLTIYNTLSFFSLAWQQDSLRAYWIDGLWTNVQLLECEPQHAHLDNPQPYLKSYQNCVFKLFKIFPKYRVIFLLNIKPDISKESILQRSSREQTSLL